MYSTAVYNLTCIQFYAEFSEVLPLLSPAFSPSVSAMLSLPALKTPAGHWRSWLIRTWMGGQFICYMLLENNERGVALQVSVHGR